MIKIRNIRDRFNPISFKLGGVTDVLFEPFELVSEVVGLGTDIYKTESAANSVEQTNATNYQIAKEKNEQEKELFHENLEFQDLQGQISRDFNAVEAQKARDFNAEQAEINRQFQTIEAQKTREWNAIDAQVARAKAAGVNPALVAGQGQVSQAQAGGSAASGGAASSTPVSGSSIPSLTAPMMQNKVQALEGLSHLGLVMSEMSKNFSQAKKQNAETDAQKTYNKYQEQLIKSGLDLNDAQKHKTYAEASLAVSKLDEIGAKVKELKANTAFMDSKTTAQDIENMYKSDWMAANINALVEKANLDKAAATCMMYKLPLELGLIKSQTALNYMQGVVAKTQAELNTHQSKLVDGYVTLVANQAIGQSTQNDILSFNYGLMKEFEPRMKEAMAKALEFQSSNTVQVLGLIFNGLNSLANGVQEEVYTSYKLQLLYPNLLFQQEH